MDVIGRPRRAELRGNARLGRSGGALTLRTVPKTTADTAIVRLIAAGNLIAPPFTNAIKHLLLYVQLQLSEDTYADPGLFE